MYNNVVIWQRKCFRKQRKCCLPRRKRQKIPFEIMLKYKKHLLRRYTKYKKRLYPVGRYTEQTGVTCLFLKQRCDASKLQKRSFASKQRSVTSKQRSEASKLHCDASNQRCDASWRGAVPRRVAVPRRDASHLCFKKVHVTPECRVCGCINRLKI